MNEKFYVLASDGLKHGPADLITLQEWANQGRITPQMQLIDESGNVYQAGEKLNFLGAPGMQGGATNDPNGPPQPGVYTPPSGGGMAGGYPPMPGQGNYGQGTYGQGGPNPHWNPNGPLDNNPMLYGPGPGMGYGRSSGGWGCLAPLLALIGFEMCCTMVPSILGLCFALYFAFSGKPWGKMMVWFASVCLGLQLTYSVWWRLHGG